MNFFSQTQNQAMKYIFATIVASLTILLFFANAPHLLPRCLQILPAPPEDWLKITDSFGSFFGGILGPIVTIAGFYFLHVTYKSQVDTQRIALLDKLYNDLLEDIKSLYYREQFLDKKGNFQNEQIHEGIDALYNYKPIINGNSVLNHLNLIINSFNQLIKHTKACLNEDSNSAYESILDKSYLMYHAKIVWPILEGLYKYRIEILLRDWGSPEILFFEFEKLTKESFDYLSKKGLVKAYKTKEHKNDIVAFLENILNTTYHAPDSRNNWLTNIELLKTEFGLIPSSNYLKIGVIFKYLLPSHIAETLRLLLQPLHRKSTSSSLIPIPPFPVIKRSDNWWLRQFDRHKEAIRKRCP